MSSEKPKQTSGKGPSRPLPPATRKPTGELEKVSKPNEALFQSQVAQLDKSIVQLESSLKTARESITKVQATLSEDETTKDLKSKLEAIRKQQAQIKAGKTQYLDQLKIIEDRIRSKQSELKTRTQKLPYQKPEEIDERIDSLEKLIESGSLKLVDERRMLNEISILKRLKKTMQDIKALHISIDEDRQLQASTRSQLEDPESKKLNQNYNKLKEEFDKIRGTQDQDYKKLRKLKSDRDEIMKKLDAAFKERRALKDTYYTSLRAFQAYEAENRKEQAAQRKAEREAQLQQKKLQYMQNRLEEAALPAYQSQIQTCDSLIRLFDQTTSAKSSGNASPTTSSPAAATAAANTNTRQVEAPENLQLFTKKKGITGALFGKKEKQSTSGSSSPRQASTSSETKFHLSLATVQDLSYIELAPPASQADLPALIEKIKERKTFYQTNEAAETERRIAAVTKELEAFELKQKSKSSKQQKQKEGEQESEDNKEDATAAAVNNDAAATNDAEIRDNAQVTDESSEEKSTTTEQPAASPVVTAAAA